MLKKLSLASAAFILIWIVITAFVSESAPDAIESEKYCFDVITQIADFPVTLSDDKSQLDIANSYYLYNFSNEPIAIFYQLNSAGYAIYDFSIATVLEYNIVANHPFYTDPKKNTIMTVSFNIMKLRVLVLNILQLAI